MADTRTDRACTLVKVKKVQPMQLSILSLLLLSLVFFGQPCNIQFINGQLLYIMVIMIEVSKLITLAAPSKWIVSPRSQAPSMIQACLYI